MTASKPEVVAYLNFGALTGEPIACNDCWSELASEPLIRLTDHERLQAEAERLQADHEAERAADKARIAELEAALSDVERDAARYRWLCSAGPGFDSRPFVVLLDLDSTKSDVDTAIDAALAQQGKEASDAL